MKEEVEAVRQETAKDMEEERSRYQKLLQDYNRMEQRCENLKEDMLALQSAPPGGAPRSHAVRTDSNEENESGYGTLSTSTTDDSENVEREIQVGWHDLIGMCMCQVKLEFQEKDI